MANPAYQTDGCAEGNAHDQFPLAAGQSEDARGVIASPTRIPAHWDLRLQRALDVILATSGLLFFFPLFLIIALAILADSRGPVLFRQYRVGKDNRDFLLYKFRSMVVDAEARRAALESCNEASGPLFKMKNDPRVTRVGRVIRRLSLDELPQLINVLRGDMAIVGPRPALRTEVEQYEAWQLNRLKVKPGITGLWQVSGRSDLSFEESVKLDLHYADRRSVLFDIKIIGMTFEAVFRSRGAY